MQENSAGRGGNEPGGAGARLPDFDGDCFHENVLMLMTEKFVLDGHKRILLANRFYSESDFVLQSEQFYLVALDTVSDLPASAGLYSAKERDTIQRLERYILRVYAQVLEEDFLTYPFMPDGGMFLLLNLRVPLDAAGAGAGTEQTRRLLEACRRGAARILEISGMYMQVYVSTLIESIDEIEPQFSAMKRFLTNSYAGGPETASGPLVTVVDQDAFCLGSLNVDKEKTRLERKLFQYAEKHDFAAAVGALDGILDMELSDPGSAVSINERMCSRIETLFGLLGVPYYMTAPPGLKIVECVRNIQNAISIGDLKEIVHGIVSDFESYFAPPAMPAANRMDEIAQYVQENFRDPDLCAGSVSRIFNISLSYLSRSFKERQGRKLIDYIHLQRTEAAKQLLVARPDLTVEQIAAAVGYLNALTFTRAFKRFMGTSPGIYRREAGYAGSPAASREGESL